MDPMLFLDATLWRIWWNFAFSITRSLHPSLPIWIPSGEIHTRLPKRIYSKYLATSDLEINRRFTYPWRPDVATTERTEHLAS